MSATNNFGLKQDITKKAALGRYLRGPLNSTKILPF